LSATELHVEAWASRIEPGGAASRIATEDSERQKIQHRVHRGKAEKNLRKTEEIYRRDAEEGGRDPSRGLKQRRRTQDDDARRIVRGAEKTAEQEQQAVDVCVLLRAGRRTA
jgi:hypothetical protein